MFSTDEASDRMALMLNSELRQAQLEMLSAQCATDRLRLRYSPEEIARLAKAEVLRKAWSSANVLWEFYNTLAKQAPDRVAFDKAPSVLLNEAKLQDATERLARHLHEQREYFRPIGRPLERTERQTLDSFFSASLLWHARLATVDFQKLPKPQLYVEGKALGFANLPEISRMQSLTFEDVVVLPREFTTKALFHALVHAVQVEVLGLERYSELIVHGLARNSSYENVPLEAHAGQLASAFANNEGQVFSVEEKVRLWTNQGRY